MDSQLRRVQEPQVLLLAGVLLLPELPLHRCVYGQYSVSINQRRDGYHLEVFHGIWPDPGSDHGWFTRKFLHFPLLAQLAGPYHHRILRENQQHESSGVL